MTVAHAAIIAMRGSIVPTTVTGALRMDRADPADIRTATMESATRAGMGSLDHEDAEDGAAPCSCRLCHVYAALMVVTRKVTTRGSASMYEFEKYETARQQMLAQVATGTATDERLCPRRCSWSACSPSPATLLAL